VLSEFYFNIMYRPGKANERADALTRREQDVAPQNALKREARDQVLLGPDRVDARILTQLPVAALEEDSSLSQAERSEKDLPAPGNFDLVSQLLAANRESTELEPMRAQARAGAQNWELRNGLLLWQERLVVPTEGTLRAQLLNEVHAQVSTAHPGISKTKLLVAQNYWWKGLSSDVSDYVHSCRACRKATVPRDRTPGYLHSLPIPDRPWQHVSMDYKSFPAAKDGLDNLFVVVDRFCKQAVSIPCSKSANARDMARMYIERIYCRYGAPQTIVSDRGPQFISSFWNEFTRILGVKLKLSTAYHPQTDGQTEIVNQYIDLRLRPFINYYQDDWPELIPMVDYAQLTLPHESLGMMSPFEVQYGYKPNTSWNWEPAEEAPKNAREKLNREEAQAYAQRMHKAWEKAKECLQRTQEVHARSANKRCRSVDFGVDDYVYVLAKNWRRERPSAKLDSQMEGPWPIIAQEGHSFRLGLPSSMKIHPVFSADRLRKAKDAPLPGQVAEKAEPIVVQDELEWELEEVLACKLERGKLKYRARWVGWEEDPEWYPASDLKYAPHLLRAFHLRNPSVVGPPLRLENWIRAWEMGIDNYDYLDSNLPCSQSSRASFFRRGG
jgi:hypothetical protein